MNAEALESKINSSQDFSGNCGVTGKLETMKSTLDGMPFGWRRLKECNQVSVGCQYQSNNLCGAVRLHDPFMFEVVVCGKSLGLDNPSTTE